MENCWHRIRKGHPGFSYKGSETSSWRAGTPSRAINLMEKALVKVLKSALTQLQQARDMPGSLVVDGTLIPTWNWQSLGIINFSCKHKCAGFNHQIICTLDGKFLAITDPVRGARYDVYAYRFHQLEIFLDEYALADKGYIGSGLLIPTKRKALVRWEQSCGERE